MRLIVGVFAIGGALAVSGCSAGAPTARPAVTVTAPAPTVTRQINVPGPTVAITRTVPGPVVDVVVTKVATRTVVKRVPGPVRKVPGPTVTVTVDAGSKGGSGTQTIAGDGTFIVGTDIQPGTYRSAAPPDDGSGDPSCYWARLSNLTGSGETAGIIANDISSGPSVVTILASDKGFTTSGCAVFTMVG